MFFDAEYGECSWRETITVDGSGTNKWGELKPGQKWKDPNEKNKHADIHKQGQGNGKVEVKKPASKPKVSG